MKLKQKKRTDVELNLTSMMDVIFLLIIFFILVTNFAAADLPELEVPEPDNSKAREEMEGTRLVNVVPTSEDPTKAAHVLIAGKRFNIEDKEAIAAMLKEEREAKGELMVDLRADARLGFDQVQPVMMAITDAGIANVNLVTIMEND
jgi:biopolymer transport protein ExbD